MNGRVIFIVVLFIVLSGFCYAQQVTIAGIIKDSTEKPIEGATVILVNSIDSLSKWQTVSNKNGYFEFLNIDKGYYELTVTHILFQKYFVRDISIDEKTEIKRLPVRMVARETNNLKEVVVTGQKAYIEQKIDRLIINVDARISNMGANTFDVLNNAPGVSIDESGGLSIRGKTGAKVLIDDKPVYLSGKDLVAYLQSLPSGTIDRIEIMSNPPAKYNAEGTAGIINIKTKRSQAKGFSGNISASYGQGVYAKTNESVNFTYRKNKMSFLGNFSYSVFNNFFKSDRIRRYTLPNNSMDYTLNQNYYERSNKKNGNYRVGWEYQLNKKASLRINANHYGGPYHENSLYQSRFLNSNDRFDSSMYVTSITSITSQSNTVNLNYRHLLSKPNAELSLDVDFLKYESRQQQLSASNTFLPDSSLSGEYILSSSNPYSAKIYGVRADYVNQIQHHIKMEAGVQNIYSQRENEGSYFNKEGNAYLTNKLFSNKFNYEENIQALYVNFNKEYKRWAWQGGLRLENTISRGNLFGREGKSDSGFTLNYVNVFPTMYFLYKLDTLNKNLLTFSAGRRILRPGYNDLNPSIFFFDKYTYAGGNPVLKPAYSSNFELTFSHANMWTTSLSYVRTKNSITQVYRQIDSAFVSNNINIDLVISLGINSNIDFRIAKWWSLNVYTELTNTHYKGVIFNDQQLDNRRTTFRFTGSTKFTFTHGWAAETGGVYKNKVLLGQVVLQAGWHLHTSLQKKAFKDKATFGLTARDIAKSWVVKRDIFIKNAHASFSNRYDTQVISFSFTYKFGKSTSSRVPKNGIQSEQNRIGG